MIFKSYIRFKVEIIVVELETTNKIGHRLFCL